jgi:arylsulfatase A-like enzyme
MQLLPMKKLKYSIKAILLVIGGTAFLISCGSKKTPGKNTEEQPNIIVIMTDDHAYQAISAYGSGLIATPNIDKIAQQGALMRRAFVTNSICSPSRAVLLTGQYSHRNGVKDNRDSFAEGLQYFPEVLKDHGYRTAIVGKWHINSEPAGFDYWNILPGQGDYYNPRFIKMGKDTVYNGYVTDVTTDVALEWLDKNKEDPFLLMIHQKAPHRNWMPALKYLDLFNDREFDFPETFFDAYEDRPALQRQKISIADNLEVALDNKVLCDTCKVKAKNKRATANYTRILNRLMPEQRKIWDKAYKKEHEEFAQIESSDELLKWQFQRYMEDYLRCVKSVDDNVGYVLNYLENKGLKKNTIVVYTSDQGFYLGEHGLFDKRFMYNESFRTPLMVQYPETIPAGQQIDNLVLNLDIAPTLLDYANVPVPEDMQGSSMKDLLNGQKVHKWRDKVYYHYYGKNFGLTAHYGIRTDRYKLIHFYDPIDAWELYDLNEDPNEVNNLYNDTEYADLVAELKSELHKLQVKYKDEEVLKSGNL